MKTLWQKGTPLDAEIATFTVWEDRELDGALASCDLLGSIAHVLGLERAGVLTREESRTLREALIALYPKAETGELCPSEQDEDIHSAIERQLTEQLGTPAKRLHTARSRNDQVAVDVALWLRERALESAELALEVAGQIIEFAGNYKEIPLPGMTHLQPAMPSSVATWALGFATLLLDDAAHCQHAHVSAASSPLGSAAGYGVPEELVKLDRAYTAALLGFERPLEPVTAAQAGRGKQEATLLFALAQTMDTLSKLAADIVLYVNPSFGFFELEVAFTTGSSIMPQKKNPDVMELVRGQGHSVRSALMEVMSLPATLPSGYHRDYQLLKAPLMRGVKAAHASLRVTAHLFQGLKVREEQCKNAMIPDLYATHRALELVARGAPFREAYAQVAQEVMSQTLPAPARALGAPPLPEGTLDRIIARKQALDTWTHTTRATHEATRARLLDLEAP